MQSATSRLNSIIMFGGTVLLAMALLNHFHGRIMYQPSPQIQLAIHEPLTLRQARQWDTLSFKYDLEANLSSLYNWNLKQLFVYIEVEWVHEEKGAQLNNRMIASDWILESPIDRSRVFQVFNISVKNRMIEYQVRDVYKSLAGKKLKVSLNVEFMPTVGFFFKDRLKEIEIQVPSKYT